VHTLKVVADRGLGQSKASLSSQTQASPPAWERPATSGAPTGSARALSSGRPLVLLATAALRQRGGSMPRCRRAEHRHGIDIDLIDSSRCPMQISAAGQT